MKLYSESQQKREILLEIDTIINDKDKVLDELDCIRFQNPQAESLCGNILADIKKLEGLKTVIIEKGFGEKNLPQLDEYVHSDIHITDVYKKIDELRSKPNGFRTSLMKMVDNCHSM